MITLSENDKIELASSAKSEITKICINLYKLTHASIDLDCEEFHNIVDSIRFDEQYMNKEETYNFLHNIVDHLID